MRGGGAGQLPARGEAGGGGGGERKFNKVTSSREGLAGAFFFTRGSVSVTSSSGGGGGSRRRASGGQPAPVSALRLPGFSGAIHPGREEGDTIRQLIHRSRRGERREERRGALPGPHHPRDSEGGRCERGVFIQGGG